MTLLKIFLVFLKIGIVSFGGGYGMISLVREECLSNNWLNEEEILNFIAVSESTPGPIAINMATFIGSSQYGVLGAIVATLGVILPAFIIILLISILVKNIIKYRSFQKILSTIRPVVVALIIATSLTLAMKLVFNVKNINSDFNFDYKSIVIIGLVFLFGFLYKRKTNKKISPIVLILFSALCGIIFYGIL